MPRNASSSFPALQPAPLPELDVLAGRRAGGFPATVRHALVVLTEAPDAPGLDLAGLAQLKAALRRRGEKPQSLQQKPLAVTLEDGMLLSWVWLASGQTPFQQQTLLCKGLAPLLEERPSSLGLRLAGAQADAVAGLAVYVAQVNGAALPSRKKEPHPALRRIFLQGARPHAARLAAARAVAEGNTLTRTLTQIPPNDLTPGTYRRLIRSMARGRGWQVTEYPLARLKDMGAGAFVAVAQGSADPDAAIVRLRYRAPRPVRHVALVGKGICFDTGGHNLKPAKYMYGMHEDMNGSAVALGILSAVSRLRLPLEVDCWLALAQNHISPRAYKQNDVVTALNGTTIEIVHTDAEGRMVLADTLTLAARAQPQLIVDFATLTGSMHTALGSRYSGIFASDEHLAQLAVAAGEASGERVLPFPLAADYDPALDSKIADVKQCTPDGTADHILAARFLSRFRDERPWLHMDLSASSNEGGLGALGTDVTGFGVSWGVQFLDSWSKNPL
ncbi:MAG: leucyl aminopeptidase family protein [Betaproteobacteria bacterium]|nr:leucyl aminopeptidase family protein [Betaproteobacteria bacterium]MDE2211631.1 leucyl aminopeptidase family protein [Betaproteobacteria bacterium]